MHAEVFCHRSAREDAYTDADVPAAQVRAVGRAALVVAGEIHAHGLVAGEDKPEARADKKSRPEEGDGRVAEREQEIRDDVERHAGAYEMHEVTPVDETAGHDTVYDEPCGDERVEPAGTADAEFLSIERDVVGHGAVGKTHEDEVHELRDGAGEEEAVERKRGVRFLLLGGDL